MHGAVRHAAADGAPVVLVAHSGAGFPASVMLDRDPAAVARVVYVDSGPAGDGAVLADLPPEVTELPLPPFEQLAEQASLDGLSEHDLQQFRDRAVPEPGPVVRAQVRVGNPDRLGVPATILACSMPSEVMLQLAREGHPMMAEVARLRDLEVVDLPTGHWPMWSRPAELAAAISQAAGPGPR